MNPIQQGAYTRNQRSYSLWKGDHRHNKSEKMRTQRSMLQMKKQDKSLKEKLDEEDTSNVPEKEFKVMIVKLL